MIWLPFLVLAGCEPAGIPSDAAVILTGSSVGTPGGTVFALTNGTASQVDIYVDEVKVEVEEFQGGLSLAKIPVDQELGPAMLSTRIRGGGIGVEFWPLEIVEPGFRRVESETGLVFEHNVDGWGTSCAQAMTGIGFADVDGDGDLDAFVGNLTAPSVFFRNRGDTDGDGLPEYAEDTEAVGLSGLDYVATANFADYDNDGDPDLFVGRRERNVLLRNDGGVFTDVTSALGLSDYEQRTMSGGWGDWDGDGDLDLYVANHAWCFPSRNEAVDQRNEDHFYRNDGDTFTELTDLFPDGSEQMSGRFGFVSLFIDVDRDADQDLVVINDLVPNGGNSIVWENQGPAAGFAMTSLGPDSGFSSLRDPADKVRNSMGLGVGDLNEDGLPDFAYSNIGHNALVLSDRTDSEIPWVDGAEAGGVWRHELPWFARSITWATHLFDYDNDGDLDLMYIGGDLRGIDPQPHAFFQNNGDNTFVDLTWQVGLESHAHGKGSALLDLDGDGFLEMVVANWSDRLEVYRNQSPDLGNDNHWLQVDLEGDGVVVNRDAFGAIVELTEVGGRVQTCFRTPQPSLSGTGDPMCHFGLGGSSNPVSIRVFWPDGTDIEVDDIETDQRLLVSY